VGSVFPNGLPVASFFVARTPLLPFDDLLSLSDGLSAPASLGDEEALASAVAADWRAVHKRIEALSTRPEVQEALFLASPDLVARLDEVGSIEDAGRVELATARYLLRMCGRATPFGLFAGFTVGTIGPTTAIELAPRSAYTRHMRLDNDYLFTLVDRLEGDPRISATLRFTPSSSLYKAAGSFRYAEPRLDGRIRTNHLVAVGATDYLQATLESAAAGATASELAAELLRVDPEISLDEASSFVGQLIESKILVSDLTPALTGKEPLDDLLERLPRNAATAAVRDRLQECRSAIAALARSPLGIARERYVVLARQFESLPADVEPSRFVQVDLVKPRIAAVLGPEPLAEIVRGVDLLWRLGPAAERSPMARFADAFFERYEGREVPLVEALDEDLGLEFSLLGHSSGGAAPLLKGLHFRPVSKTVAFWTPFHKFLHQKLSEALADGRDELTLDSSDVEALQQVDAPPLPAAFSATATVGASSAAAVARGEFDIVLQSVVGPSGANWLGRFCNADPELTERVVEHLRSEELHEPHAVFAEIVHLPEGRMGNVIVRPVLRGHEIPYLGRSSATIDRQIPVTDLMLAIEDGRLVVRSRRLGREVIPRLTTAHNYHTSALPIYRFLAAFANYDAPPFAAWDWGPLASSTFLPRVRSGRVVLAPARWRVSKAEANRLREARGARRYRLVQEWRLTRRFPRFVLVTESDNRMPIDLDNVLCVEVLADLAARRNGATLQEMFPRPEALFASGPEGRFVHELIVPFVQPRAPKPARLRRARLRSEMNRSFPPGTEWMYAKLFTSEYSADRVLREVVAPLKRIATERRVVDRWFFIRYADPQNHLRIRFHGDPTELAEALIPALRDATEPLLRERTLWRVQLDTYEREIERYGGDEGMIVAERLFFADSEAVLDLLDGFAGDEGAHMRSNMAFVGIDRLLDVFGCDLAAKRRIVAALRDATGRDVHVNKQLRRQLGDKFRGERRELTRLLDGERDDEDALRPGLAVLARRSVDIAPIAAELSSLAREGRLTTELPTIVASHIHMFVNRLMRSQHKRQEFVLYDYLDRIYDSRMARGAQSG